MSKIDLQRKEHITYASEEIDKITDYYDDYRKNLINSCLPYFNYEYDSAEDCVQSAFVSLIENLNSGIKIENYYSWLYDTTINHKNTALNDKKDSIVSESFAYENGCLEKKIGDDIIEERAIDILSSLKDWEIELYLLHYVEKKNFKEIAQHMGISHISARQRHFLVKKKIIEMIKTYETGFDNPLI